MKLNLLLGAIFVLSALFAIFALFMYGSMIALGLMGVAALALLAWLFVRRTRRAADHAFNDLTSSSD
ncbi:hypothetical protein [Ponticaulis profundi]|uniref:CTP synthetase n=1 Tax=Ponticaulis profundi TaxID=2665222 RepID=A0ABW1S5B0_9PROT